MFDYHVSKCFTEISDHPLHNMAREEMWEFNSTFSTVMMKIIQKGKSEINTDFFCSRTITG